jgi:protein gp37
MREIDVRDMHDTPTGHVDHGPGPRAVQQSPTAWLPGENDLFHARVPDTFIAQVFAVMAAASHHSFQVLTKRPQRMARLLGSDAFAETVFHLSAAGYGAATLTWPLPNLWLGTSVEDQKRANQRIPKLLATATAIRFLSCEPLLGPIDLQPEWVELEIQAFGDNGAVCFPRVDWIIVGGESGPGARPMHPAWARSLRDQAVAADVAFFFKQWGAFAPEAAHAWRWPDSSNRGGLFLLDPRGNGWTWRPGLAPPDTVRMRQVGKHRAGRLLDGCTWDQYPTTWGGAPTGQGPGAR